MKRTRLINIIYSSHELGVAHSHIQPSLVMRRHLVPSVKHVRIPLKWWSPRRPLWGQAAGTELSHPGKTRWSESVSSLYSPEAPFFRPWWLCGMLRRTGFALADPCQRIRHDAMAQRWKVCSSSIFSDVTDAWIRTALFCRSAGLACSHRVIPLWLYDIFSLNMNVSSGLQRLATQVCMSPSCIYRQAAG